MRARSHRESELSSISAARGGGAAGRHHLLTPKGVLRLQREAGNGAVAGALSVQRTKKGEMFEFKDGTIEGLIDNKHTIISVTDGWLK